MQTIEYRDTLDKAGWPRGAWDNEPDKTQWQDNETGFPCLIVRNKFGALCGYVGVPEGHPWHGMHYDVVRKADGDWPDVHGGLTFSGGCQHGTDPSEGICHIPEVGEPDNVWWLGFDCAHAGDFCPRLPVYRDDIYRDMSYVRSEVANLASQAAGVLS